MPLAVRDVVGHVDQIGTVDDVHLQRRSVLCFPTAAADEHVMSAYITVASYDYLLTCLFSYFFEIQI